MTKMKLIGAVAFLSAVIAAPVLAQDEGGVLGPGSRKGLTPQPGPTHHLRGHHNRNGFAHFSKTMRYRSSMASSSRPGGEPVSRKPAGN
jgi:hypothetical protein